MESFTPKCLKTIIRQTTPNSFRGCENWNYLILFGFNLEVKTEVELLINNHYIVTYINDTITVVCECYAYLGYLFILYACVYIQYLYDTL